MAAKRSITGNTAAQERRIQVQIAESIERTHAAKIARELRRAYIDIAMARMNGLFVEAVQKHKDNMLTIMEKMYTRTWQVYGRRMFKLTKSDGEFETKDAITDGFDRARRRWIAEFGSEKVTKIAGTTREQAIELINAAITESIDVEFPLGETARAKLIRSTVAKKGGDLSRFRSFLIARTEVHNAASVANHEAAGLVANKVNKEWLAAEGGDSERSREWHKEMNGVTVAYNDDFIVDGEPMSYPGDPRGSARNVINCRCVVAYMPI